jgi:signal transduction histidine kinase
MVMGPSVRSGVADDPTIRESTLESVRLQAVRRSPSGVRLEDDAPIGPGTDAQQPPIRYVRDVNWMERQLERIRSINPLIVDGACAVLLFVLGVVSSFGQNIRDDQDVLKDGFREPNAWVVLTALIICAPVMFRRRWPLGALVVSSLGVLVHIVAELPEGSLPATVLFLTFSVGAWCSTRRSLAGLAFVSAVIVLLGLTDSPGLDAVGVLAVILQFAAVWAIGVGLRSRRTATEARVREADERAEAEHQSAARVLAEERLRIAQELHDVVAHSMSVIAVQAGVGAHVLDERPEQARAALEAISATSRGTLTELRRLLGVLRDSEGVRSHAPAPGLSDLPHLVEDVRAAGVPAQLQVEGQPGMVHAGLELSAYRIVQEALTNVIKHAGKPSHVDVTVRYLSDSLAVEVVDDGRGVASQPRNGDTAADGSGHGLIGMRERVEVWGGELSAGAAPGGGYRVKAQIPYCDAE